MKVTPEMLQTFRDIVKANQAADQQLYTDLEKLGKWLLQYNDNNGSLPGPDNNVRAIERYLDGMLAKNPYRAEPLDPAKEAELQRKLQDEQKEEPEEAPRVRLIFDYGLSPAGINTLMDNPPSEWSATPGSAVIICNAQKLALLWGAGSDQRPLRNHVNGKMRAVILQAP
jgi:hypothetical protein